MLIQENIDLSDKNWFGTGGKARYFCQPETEQEFVESISFAQKQNQDIFLLGRGANILISDDGFDGLVICPLLSTTVVDRENGFVAAGAGADLQDLINLCLDNNLIGLEEFSGIPGTVGGSMYINVHYFKSFLSDFLEVARVIDRKTSEFLDVEPSWFNFGYDQSKLFDKQHFLVSAMFKLRRVDDLSAAYAKGRRDEIIRHRNQRYPNNRTCGSFFKNFKEDEIPFKINGKKIPFVAYYLDKLGIKGELRVGSAMVSHQHANMLVTLPGATTSDVIQLARTMQQEVKKKFGIIPQSECQLVGFGKYPLL